MIPESSVKVPDVWYTLYLDWQATLMSALRGRLLDAHRRLGLWTADSQVVQTWFLKILLSTSW